MKKSVSGMLVLAIAAGCASPMVFDERANGQTVEVEQGRAFSVSLAGTGWTLTPPGGVVAPTGRARQEAENRDVFQFKAETLGDVELRFSKGDSKKVDCTIRVKVKPPSEYYMKPHTG
jgi:hypothetical protein